jgi:hypothetical protein
MFSIWLLVLLTGCPTEGATGEDGTVSLRVTGADAHDGVALYTAIGAKGADLNNQANWLGDGNGPTITGGIAETLYYDVATVTTPVIFTGGESYDMGGMIDADNSGDYTSGVDYVISSARTVVVDGDMLEVVVYPADFVLAP